MALLLEPTVLIDLLSEQGQLDAMHEIAELPDVSRRLGHRFITALAEAAFDSDAQKIISIGVQIHEVTLDFIPAEYDMEVQTDYHGNRLMRLPEKRASQDVFLDMLPGFTYAGDVYDVVARTGRAYFSLKSENDLLLSGAALSHALWLGRQRQEQ